MNSNQSLLKKTLTGAAILTGVALFVSCSTPATDDAAQDVTLMLNWTSNAHHAGIYYAQEHGLYDAAGINLTIIEPGADVGADVAVAEGQVEFGISQAESLLPARAQGMGVQAVATLLPVNDSALMGIRSSGLTESPSSLEGLTFGGWGGALETEIISELVLCAGGDPANVEFVDIGNVDYLAGLEQGRFGVTWVFGGWDALRAQEESDEVVMIPFEDHLDCIPNWYTPVIIGNEEALVDSPQLARDFLAATSEGYAAVQNDPEAGAEALLAAAPELDEQLVRNAVAYYSTLFTGEGSGFGMMEDDVWSGFTDFLVNAGMLDDSTPVDGAWTNEYLPSE